MAAQKNDPLGQNDGAFSGVAAFRIIGLVDSVAGSRCMRLWKYFGSCEALNRFLSYVHAMRAQAFAKFVLGLRHRAEYDGHGGSVGGHGITPPLAP